MDYRDIKKVDPEIYDLLGKELKRQRDNIELIASENIASPAVLEALGSVPQNKYAEGLPGKRYYGGCKYVDMIENIAIDRVCKLFHAKYANVQGHSGSTVNYIAYKALGMVLRSAETDANRSSDHVNDDTILSLDLSMGGHISHGLPISFSGSEYHIVSYALNTETGIIDYDQVRKLAMESRPRVIVAGASAYPRIIDWKKFREIADECGALLMVDMAHIAGLIAAGVHPSPIPYADIVTSTCHKSLRGPRGGFILVGDADKKFDTEEEQAAYEEKCSNLIKMVNKKCFPYTQGGPLEHVITAKAVSFKECLSDEFKEYGKQIVKNAKVLADTLMSRGVELVSGGTDNHLMLIDLSNRDVTGKELEHMLEEANITTNKNTVPNEKRSPFVTSGLRIGTPAVTTRGMKEEDMVVIGNLIADIIDKGEEAIPAVKAQVKVLTDKYPLYEGDIIE